MNVPLFLAADDSVLAGIGGVVSTVFVLGAVMLALCWVVFPFIVIGKFNALIGEVRNLRTELKMRRDENKTQGSGVPAATKKDDGHRPPLQPKEEQSVYRI